MVSSLYAKILDHAEKEYISIQDGEDGSRSIRAMRDNRLSGGKISMDGW
jgi:hypothetical protein